ncbi:3 beta-hydroxysteroid dehydrogenase type 7 [Acipenser ruthenus]|uniref:3 beta-hydroxysteroid dehydrogenase type 7 n=1 Tax=Acipenser ruthenus TaxID=7906 RepID=UPI00145A964D|nr:3 beta-hydroxysteroid dehydrogenase type 7 [Acipenser ruthenus]XP_033853168.1 3 beta-hydroxysteroid dehydrogenase type 7 [Acipenser ruthenus]XP_033853169.1 3 beta-hydroxysteroid dehydrogenase type 7 [Acipenser ruthenus]XP_058872950.1 3 beta-hydroxysteroid dehydrogenase type 7 [Acipenser ruthenus]
MQSAGETMAAKPGLVYLVTGGCGFLGQHVFRMLLEKEDNVAEVRLFDLAVDDSLANLSTEKITVKLIQGDITDLTTVLKVTEGVDVVIHSASLVDVWHKVPESKIQAVNVQGTCHVIQACQDHGIQYLIYTSSMEVVGPNVNGEPFYRGNEDTEYNIFHNMPYPKSKAQAERLVIEANGRKVNGGKTLYTCALRPTGIYGEKHELMRQFYNMGMRTGGWMLRAIPGNIEHGRVYAGNVAWMHLLVARMIREKPEVVGGQVYFCYDDSPYKSYEDFNMEFLSRFGFREVRIPYFVLTVMAMVNDFLRTLLKPLVNYTPLMNRYTLTVASTTFTVKTDKAERDFGYRPLYSWQQCRDNTIAWISTFAEGVDAQKEK